jgi:thymidylate synthase
VKKYHDILRQILNEGEEKTDPQGVGNISTVGIMAHYDLNEGFPLITSRNLQKSWKAIVVELLWYLSGETNVAFLHKYGVHSWDQWATPEICEALGLEPGGVGPIYPKQWRSFGPEGIDQIKFCVDLLKKNPDSRRIGVTSWNPAELDKVFVAPCHDRFYFYHANGKLSLQLSQRANDVPVGTPFNVAAYSLLTMMMAQVVGLKPHKFIHSMVDCHIYKDQIEGVQKMLTREPYSLPQVKINPDVKDIFSFHPDDFELVNYQAHPYFKIPVAT